MGTLLFEIGTEELPSWYVAQGRAALVKLEEFEPDVILIDVLMPGKSGLDLLVTIRRDPRWGEVPLVVVTPSLRPPGDSSACSA